MVQNKWEIKGVEEGGGWMKKGRIIKMGRF